ncbi:MAG: hypothetical protein JOY71_29440 [Acetobacteraceae bacterium]|nr:hypothetical protein [Acetobacteraceae bacterium]
MPDLERTIDLRPVLSRFDSNESASHAADAAHELAFVLRVHLSAKILEFDVLDIIEKLESGNFNNDLSEPLSLIDEWARRAHVKIIRQRFGGTQEQG